MAEREKIKCFDDLAVWIAEFTAKFETRYEQQIDWNAKIENQVNDGMERLSKVEVRVTILSMVGSLIGSSIGVIIVQAILYLAFKK